MGKFPRPISRGPIEAATSRALNDSACRCFRGRSAAAEQVADIAKPENRFSAADHRLFGL